MTISDGIQIASIIVTTIASFVAIIVSIASLIQNRNIIKESNAPKLILYADVVTTGYYASYYVIKNLGNTETAIRKISYPPEIHELDKKFFDSLEGTTLMPNQQIVSTIVEENLPNKVVNFSIKHSVYDKDVTSSFNLNLGLLKSTIYNNQQTNKNSTTEQSIDALNNNFVNSAHQIERKLL